MAAGRRPWITLAAGLALFALLAADLLLHGPVTSADPAVSVWLHERMNPVLTQVLFLFTHVHSTIGIIAMSALLALFCAVRGRARLIPWLVLTVQGGQVLNVLVKDSFQRPRPHWDSPLVELATYSFPSGHASGATFFWGFVGVLASWWPASDRTRHVIAAVAAAMVAFTSLSRVYLGAHYLSDVLAGIGEGVAWVSVCVLLHRARTMRG